MQHPQPHGTKQPRTLPESGSSPRTTFSAPVVSAERQEALRALLVTAAASLHSKRAADIGDAVIEDLVALSWLEWAGGSLRLTSTGQNICAQVRESQ